MATQTALLVTWVGVAEVVVAEVVVEEKVTVARVVVTVAMVVEVVGVVVVVATEWPGTTSHCGADTGPLWLEYE